ncbi:MAG: hypothetical protein DMF98_26880 [Acidobacteria bacterium]|nr:MAG: hypothetical protein DMF98_26880 [Acidobacteriota bacterium]
MHAVDRFTELDGIDVLRLAGTLSPPAKARVPHPPAIRLAQHRRRADRQIVVVGPFQNGRPRETPPLPVAAADRQADMILERRQHGRHPADVIHVELVAGVDDPGIRDAVFVEGARLADVEHGRIADRQRWNRTPGIDGDDADPRSIPGITPRHVHVNGIISGSRHGAGRTGVGGHPFAPEVGRQDSSHLGPGSVSVQHESECCV